MAHKEEFYRGFNTKSAFYQTDGEKSKLSRKGPHN